MTLGKKLKSLIKKPAGKETFGTNPMDPWSARANISEANGLNDYLKSKGINPEFVSRDAKISHAKSLAYQKWKREHQTEETVHEDITGIGGAPSSTPTKKAKSSFRVAKSAQKEIKTPKGPGTHHESKGSQTPSLTPEAFENTAQARNKAMVKGVDTTPKTALDKFRAAASARAKKHADIEKKSGGMTSAIDRLEKHLNKEETVTEMDKTQDAPGRDSDYKLGSKEYTGKPVTSKSVVNKFHKKLDKLVHSTFGKSSDEKKMKEDVGDAKAAVHADGQTAAVDQMQAEKKMSKVNRIKRMMGKTVKEDIYDHEKEDKSVATYGKKPKMEKADKEDSIGEKKPQAAATLSGGKTLTGTERDTVEIDPMMRNRPGQPDVSKKDDKKDDKKEDKKKDK